MDNSSDSANDPDGTIEILMKKTIRWLVSLSSSNNALATFNTPMEHFVFPLPTTMPYIPAAS